MQQPTDIGCELHRFRARQKHAVVECVEESRFADPAPFFDQHAMHQRDLSGRSAETHQSDLEPDPDRIAERNGMRRRDRDSVLAARVNSLAAGGQPWVSPVKLRHQA